MERLENQAHTVLACYDLPSRAVQLESLGGAGGFSGACLWRLACAGETLCLRRWPREHPSAEQLGWIHAVLHHVARQGFPAVPVPRKPRGTHATYVAHATHLWELTPWMPGQADYRQHPSPARLYAALDSLARFHRAAESFPPGHPATPVLQHAALDRTALAPSPGLRQRTGMLRHWVQGGLAQLSAAMAAGNWPELAERGYRIVEIAGRLAPLWLPELDRLTELRVELQPCIRDIWHDHVLFQGDRVTGLVDFGALRWETVSGDVARLLGSLAGDDPIAWRCGLEAYEQRRPLSDAERRLLPWFDRTGVLLGGMNWLKWVYLEGRNFDRPSVLERVDAILARLPGRERDWFSGGGGGPIVR